MHGHSATPNASVKARVRAFLDANPNLDSLSVNQVLITLKEAGVKAERTTVGEVLQNGSRLDK